MARPKVPFRERYRVSKAILRQSMSMLRTERDLYWLPAAGLAVMVVPMVLLVALGIVLSDTWLASGTLGAKLAFGLGALVLMYPFMLLVTTFNAALVFAAHERMEGRPGTKREALGRAWGQVGAIARFSLVAMLVAGLFQVVGVLLEKARIVPYLGRVVEAVGAFAWAAATFFVIPILVVERERSAIGAIKGSASMAREQWGKSVAGMVTIGLVFLVPMLAFLALWMMVSFGVFAYAIGSGDFGILLSVMVAMMVPFAIVVFGLGVLNATATALYQTALFRYARTGIVTLPYTPDTLVDAWAPYQK